MTSSSGQTMASGDQGSSSSVPVISAISECGLRNAMPAQTPSAPVPRPRTWDSRWLSQRSTPRAGTRTSSIGERVVEGLGEEGAEAVGEEVGPLGAVKVKCHRAQPRAPVRRDREVR